jgi:hypothetical protein
MERIQELLTRLTDLSDAEVAELEGLILSEFDSVEGEDPTADNVERMVSLADAIDTVRGETSRRHDAAEELVQKAAEASARVHSEGAPAVSEMASSGPGNPDEEKTTDNPQAGDGAPAPAPGDADPNAATGPLPVEPPPEGGAPAEPAADVAGPSPDQAAPDGMGGPAAEPPPPGGDVSVSEEEKKKSAAASTAPPAEAPTTTELAAPDGTAEAELSATDAPQENTMADANQSGTGVVVTPPADAAPVPTPREGVGLTITAGADITGISAGTELTDMDQVSEAFAKRLHTLRNVTGGSAQQHVVATLNFDYPEDRRLHGDNPDNIRKVNKVTAPDALVPMTAAAAVCAPLETVYDINVCGVTDRPIRDALARFNADRGGVRIFGTPTLGAPQGVGIWNPGLDQGTTLGPAKACQDAICPTPDDIYLEAVYSCLKFNNFTNRFFPEVVKANTDLSLIQHARVAELNLIKKIFALSTPATGKAVVNMGFTRVLIRTILDASAWMRRRYRLGANEPMRVILPSWVQDALDADLAQQMPGDGMDALLPSTPAVNALFGRRGVNVTWALDDWNATGDPGAAPTNAGQGFKTTVSYPMFPEGDFLFLDGGTLDLGVQRDSTMLASNEYATFMETFEGVAKTGCDSLWITQDVCISGAAAALVAGVC